MASFTITDTYTGTATVVISGTSGAAWQLKTARWQGLNGISAWVNTSTGTGDQTLTGVVPAAGVGIYLWALVVTGVWETPKYQNIRDPNKVPWERAVDNIATTVESLALLGLAAGSVKKRHLPFRIQEDPLPCVVVAPYPAEQLVGTTNLRDQVNYPVTVAFYDTSGGKLDRELGRWLNWRHRVACALIEARQETGPLGVFRTTWQPTLPQSVEALKADQLLGAMMFYAHAWNPRGAI